MKDVTPELGVERGFYQQDINSVCNASPRPLKGTGSEIEAPYQMLQNWGLLYRNSCFPYHLQLRLISFCFLAFMLRDSLNEQFVFANLCAHAATVG